MSRPIAARRLHEILDRVEAATSVSVEELADHFGVSRETIRRDLKALAARGRVEVVHGGALKRSANEPPFEQRTRENADGKAAIGRMAASLVEPGMVVVLDSGTTTHAVALQIAALQPRDVTVCATSLADAQVLVRAGLRVAMLGGEVDREDEATMGGDVILALARYRVDLAFVGVGGVTPEGDITVFSRGGAETRTVMIDGARAAYLVSDSSKFGRAGPARLTWASPPAGFITDREPSPEFAAALLARDLDVIVADPT